MALTNEQLIDLYIKSCPVFYFHEKEPYMPCDFDDILRVSNVNVEEFKINYKDIKMITIPEENKFNHPIGKQILCKTLGEYTVANVTYIDLMYVLTFTWNGTREPHAFDKEQACVRLVKKGENIWEIYRVFGSAHGGGMWWDAAVLDREDTRVILYPGNESHALYSIAKTHRRIFGFGDDKCARDIRWMPTEFVVYETGPTLSEKINIYDDNKTLIRPDVSYFAYSGNIGNEENNQEWAGNIIFDPINFNGFYKYQGGIDSLFSGHYKVISRPIRYLIRTITGVLWLVFFGYLVHNSLITNSSFNSVYKKLGIFGLQLLVVVMLFITGAYMSWEIFILSPVNDHDVYNPPIDLELDE
jgi:hypothetical protein